MTPWPLTFVPGDRIIVRGSVIGKDHPPGDPRIGRIAIPVWIVVQDDQIDF